MVVFLSSLAFITLFEHLRASSYLFDANLVLGKPNFGAIEINWNETPVKLKFEVRDVEGYPVAAVNISLSELQEGNVKPVAVSSGEYRRHCSLEVNLPWIVRYRLIILFYCFLSGASFIFLAYSFHCISIDILQLEIMFIQCDTLGQNTIDAGETKRAVHSTRAHHEMKNSRGETRS